MLGYDDRDQESLRDKIYAPDVLIAYSQLLGTEPYKVTREEWLQSLKRATDGFDSKQHTVQAMLIVLPQPTNGATRPKTVQVAAYVTAHMGRSYFELERFQDLEDKGKNPWGITKMRVQPAWEDGNTAVLEAAKKRI